MMYRQLKWWHTGR